MTVPLALDKHIFSHPTLRAPEDTGLFAHKSALLAVKINIIVRVLDVSELP